jgi:UDP-N-acetylmuramoyl-tripeptide--D-alanyl-D-alanine ligase
VAALVERPLTLPIPQVIAPDALAALSVFARNWRRSLTLPVVGVTGSNGKTTTKEIIGAILSRLGDCLVTQGNLNNHIGVPLTLLRLSAVHRTVVIEMGANHLGEIAQLAGIAEPTIGIVTNAGAAHLEGFGSLEGVAQGKGELFEALPSNAVAVINADDVFADRWKARSNAGKTLTFGLKNPADFNATNVRSQSDEHGFRSDFTLNSPAGRTQITLRLAGEHNVRNALGAAATAFAAGASLEDIAAGCAAVQAVAGRLQLKAALNGAFVVDDAYNANPSSLKAGLDALKTLSGEHWLVLGDMRELGADADAMHAEIGRYAREEAGVHRLLAIGTSTPDAVKAFGSGAQWFADIDALIAELRGSLHRGVAVLVKGSRANRLERVTAALTGSDSAAH